MRRTVTLGLVLVFLLSSFLFGAQKKIYVPDRAPGTPEVLMLRDLRDGKITQAQADDYEAMMIFRPGALPKRYRDAMPLRRRTCETSDMIDMHLHWKSIDSETRKAIPQFLRPGKKAPVQRVLKGTLPAFSMEPQPLPGKVPAPENSYAPSEINQHVYVTKNFRIHWNSTGDEALGTGLYPDSDGNGIPDGPQVASEALETAWTWFSEHGYRMPPGTDSYYYEFYFGGTDPNTLGVTTPIEFIEEIDRVIPRRANHYSSSFIVMGINLEDIYPDGRIVPPLDLLRCVCVHEFFHAIQMGYNDSIDANIDWSTDPVSGYTNHWWSEACSKWSEVQPGPEYAAVASPAAWLSDFLMYPEIALDSPEWDAHWYMDCIWPIYLQTHLSPDASVIREIWETCDSTNSAVDATNSVLARHLPGGFAQAFRSFLLANLQQDYPDAGKYPLQYSALWYDLKVSNYPLIQQPPFGYYTEGLGAGYLLFSPELPRTQQPIALDFNVAVNADPANWLMMLVRKNNGVWEIQDTTPGVTVGISNFAMTDLFGNPIYTPDAIFILSPFVANDWNFYAYDVTATEGSADTTSPTPDPMTWLETPHAISSSAIAMSAQYAFDALSMPVTYFFEELTGNPGGASSGWIDDNIYTGTGLSPNVQYTYTAMARDSAIVPNVSKFPAPAVSVYTWCNVPAKPTLKDPSPTKYYIEIHDVDAGNNPLNPDGTEYAVYNTSTGMFVGADGNPTILAYFTTAQSWALIRIKGLQPGTTYIFQLKARNHDNVETDLGPGTMATTLVSDTRKPAVTGLTMDPVWVKQGQTKTAVITASTTDRPTGGSDILQAEYFIGGDPSEGHGIPMQAADGAFDSPVETVTATLNTTTWLIANNPYIVSVRCRDEAGNWSPAVAMTVTVADIDAPSRIDLLRADYAFEGSIPQAAGLTLISATSEDPSMPAANAIDRNEATAWATSASGTAESDSINLSIAGNGTYSKLVLFAADPALFPSRFRVKLGHYDSATGVTEWRTVVSEDSYEAAPGQNPFAIAPTPAEYLTLEIEYGPQGSVRPAEIAEIQLFPNLGGAHTVILSWNAPTDVGPTGRADHYIVEYSMDKLLLESKFDADPVTGILASGILVPVDAPPTPAAPGAPQSMQVKDLQGDTTYNFAMKSVDGYDNKSEMSNTVTIRTLPDSEPYIMLDAPQDGGNLSVSTPPTFAWHANKYSTFHVLFSNVPGFPSKPVVDALNRTERTLVFAPGAKKTSFKPTAAQWKRIKTIAAGMDGTIYWKVVGKSSDPSALIGTSEVFHEYGFDLGSIMSATFTPFDMVNGYRSIWPNSRPQFTWTTSDSRFSRFFIDFSTSQDNVSVFDRGTTAVVPCRKNPHGPVPTWYKPNTSNWKRVKKALFAGTDPTGVLYWRIRGVDSQGAYSVATDPAPLAILPPEIRLRLPEPKSNGTADRDLPFTLRWDIIANGYPYFKVQFSTSQVFPADKTTITFGMVRGTSFYVNAAASKRVGRLYDAAGAGAHLYWRVLAYESDRTFYIPSGSEGITLIDSPK